MPSHSLTARHLCRLISIHANALPLCPVVDTRGCAPNFTVPSPQPTQYPTNLYLGDSTVPETTQSPIPTAFHAAVDDLTLQFVFDFDEIPEFRDKNKPIDGGNAVVTQSGEGSGFFDLSFKGNLWSNGQYPFTERAFPVLSARWEFTSNRESPFKLYMTARCDGSLLLKKANEPWGFAMSGSLMVSPSTFKRTSQMSGPFECPVALEMYGIFPGIPRFLFMEGVPAHLLQFSLGPREPLEVWAAEGRDIPKTESFDQDITSRVFNSGFKYERSFGTRAFTDGAGYVFNLNKWLNIWTVLSKRASPDVVKAFEMFGYNDDRNAPTVNCYDQAGILSLCMSLTFKDEIDREALVCYFMRPYGFINKTNLVGWGDCNSPLIQGSHDLLVDRMSKDRSKFGNHVFFAWHGKVYDACAGPVRGNVSLPQYIEDAIDTQHRDVIVDDNDAPPSVDGKVKDATPYVPASTHGEWMLGELTKMLRQDFDLKKARQKENLLQNEDPNFGIDILNLEADLKIRSKNMYTVVAVGYPDIFTFGEGPLEKGTYRKGYVEWTIRVSVTGQTYPVRITLRIYENAEHASHARASFLSVPDGTSTTVPDDVAKKIVAGKPDGRTDSSKAVNKNEAVILYSCSTVHCESDLPLDVLLQLTSDVIDCGKRSKPLPELDIPLTDFDTRNWEALKGKDFYSKRSPAIVNLGQKITVKVPATNVADIDWTYQTGSIFLLDYSYTSNASGKFDFVFTFVGRKYGGEDFKLIFYDRVFNTEAIKLAFRVV